MDKAELLQKLKDSVTGDDKTFHVISVMVNDSADKMSLKSARELEQDGVIKLEVCERSEVNNTPAVDLKGYFL